MPTIDGAFCQHYIRREIFRFTMMRLQPSRAIGLFPRIGQTSVHHIPASTRFASLSAIHRGLRRTEKVQYGDVRPYVPTRGRRDKDDSEGLTAKALEGASSKRQQLKLLRKLKRKEEEEDGTGRQTRRKRFNDPESDFGKKSLVYQLKHGSLKGLVNKIDDPVRPRTFRDRRREPRREPRPSQPTLSGRPSSAEFTERFHSPSRTENPTKGPARRGPSSRSSGFGRNGLDGLAPPTRKGPGETEHAQPQVTTLAPRERIGKLMPITIKYTTAASQFLYGKSVVKAALEQGRRQLYNLYIYGGENRRDSMDNIIISRLAERNGVPVTIVPNEDQRLMDKMSQGRPHNGFVLETSPIPQLPIKALGQLEETPSRLGFNVELDHQTKEEEDVNGTNSFIQRSSSVTAKPYILLLNEILDPGNLGALLRTASYFGVDAVGITSRNSSKLSPVVLKSAAGAVEEMTIFTVDSPVSFLEASRRAGWVSYAAIPPPDKKLVRKHSDKFISTDDIEKQMPLSDKPCILVLGNEGYGLSKDIKVAADYELSIPRFLQDSSVDSLNVGVAAGLLCHSFVKDSSASRSVLPSREASTERPAEEPKPHSKSKGEDVMF